MSSFSNKRADSEQSLNSEFLIHAMVEKLFTEKNFVVIEKNFNTSNLQLSPEKNQQDGPIFMEISSNDACKICFKYCCPKSSNLQIVMKIINEANVHGKTHNSKFLLDMNTNILVSVTIVRVNKIQKGTFLYIENLVQGVFSSFSKIIRSINSKIDCIEFKKTDLNDTPALKKLKVTFEKIKWLSMKKIINKRKTNYLYSSYNKQKCPLNFQLINIQGENQQKYNQSQIEKIYEHFCRDWEKKRKDKKNQNNILSGIQLKKIEDVNQEMPESKFSKVKLLKVIYQIEKTSINKRVIDEVGRELSEEKQGFLISKTPKGYGQRSFKVEISILRHIRMEVCSNISNYYIERLLEPTSQPNCLYSNFYEGDIGSDTLGLKKQFRLMESLASGLWFLEAIKIVHRDLKPKNILYSSQPNLCCKIIDFGSAHPLQKYVQVKLQLNQPLSTTLKYNLFQQDTPLEIQSLYTPTLFEQHENYDMYAYGVMLDEFFSSSINKQVLGEYVWENLMWMKDHLKLYDPNDRLNPVQLGILMKLLLKYFVASKISP